MVLSPSDATIGDHPSTHPHLLQGAPETAKGGRGWEDMIGGRARNCLTSQMALQFLLS